MAQKFKSEEKRVGTLPFSWLCFLHTCAVNLSLSLSLSMKWWWSIKVLLFTGCKFWRSQILNPTQANAWHIMRNQWSGERNFFHFDWPANAPTNRCPTPKKNIWKKRACWLWYQNCQIAKYLVHHQPKYEQE